MRVREGINAPELRATVAQIYGRARKSWYLKINPVWWFMNDDEQTVDQADWYHPEWPYWRRRLYWNVFRNPLQNFRAYVVGASDKNYWVRGRAPIMTVQRNDLVPPEYGYQWCMLYGGELWLPRLFLSYSGKSFVWYVGHQPSGFWGVKRPLSTLRAGKYRELRRSCGSRVDGAELIALAIPDHCGVVRGKPSDRRRNRMVLQQFELIENE